MSSITTSQTKDIKLIVLGLFLGLLLVFLIKQRQTQKYFIVNHDENLYDMISQMSLTHVYISNEDCLRAPRLNFASNTMVKVDGTDMNRFTIESYRGISDIQSIVFPIAIWGNFANGYPQKGTLGTYYDMTALTNLETITIWKPYTFLTDVHTITISSKDSNYYYHIKFNMKKYGIVSDTGNPEDSEHMKFVFKTKHQVKFSYMNEKERKEFLDNNT